MKKTPKVDTRKWDGPVDFMTAFQALNSRKTIQCIDGGSPVIYGVSCEELLINGEVKDFRNFCFAPSQIAFGQWYIKKSKGEGTE